MNWVQRIEKAFKEDDQVLVEEMIRGGNLRRCFQEQKERSCSPDYGSTRKGVF